MPEGLAGGVGDRAFLFATTMDRAMGRDAAVVEPPTAGATETIGVGVLCLGHEGSPLMSHLTTQRHAD